MCFGCFRVDDNDTGKIPPRAFVVFLEIEAVLLRLDVTVLAFSGRDVSWFLVL